MRGAEDGDGAEHIFICSVDFAVILSTELKVQLGI